MLQFWKKTVVGQKEDASSSKSSSPTRSISSNQSAFATIDGTKSGQCSCDYFPTVPGPLAPFEDEGLFDLCEPEMIKQHSRLTKTLDEVLDDKQALAYFAQYLESRTALSYLHCWMDIEQFKLEAQKFLDNTKEDSIHETRSLLSPLSCTRVDHDSLSVSTDCDSYTGDSNSLCDYSEGKMSMDAKNTHCNSICDNTSNDTSHTVISCNKTELSNSSNEQSKSPTYCKTLQTLTDDALKIFKMYISLEATETIHCTEDIRKTIIENICDTSRSLSYTCFQKLELYLHEFLEKEFFQGFLGSDYFFKHQIDVLTSGDIVLDDILYNETALFYFMEFLEQENSRCLLEFWIAATNFQMQLNQQKEFFDAVEAQNDAVVLYDRYFSLQAHCPLGFSDKIRFAVEQTICGENGVVLDCFHLPLKLVEQVLDKNHLKPFVASHLFYKYLSELINSVHGNTNLSSPDGKYAPSECSSERSSNNTFLAMHIPLAKTRKNKGTDMHIDSRQLYDPDSLWRRRRNNRLSFGRITALGRYETDFEPEPDRKSTSRLKNVVKKFVNIEEDKKKEEMAWQVAEMIVKDITNITLHEQRDYNS